MRQNQLLAAQVVTQVLAGESLTAVLTRLWSRESALSPADRGAIQDFSYGSLRHLSTLQACVDSMTARPVEDEQIRVLLCIALYQLIHTRNAPFTVVNEAVAAAGSVGKPWAKGLVNALLRRFQRERDALMARVSRDPARGYAYPQWWVDLLRRDHPAQWEVLLAEGNRHPPMTLRVNRRVMPRDQYLTLLAQAAIEASALGDSGIMLAAPVPVSMLPGFEQGWVSVQDYGAQLSAPLLDVQPGMRVLDACAAPGGKTAHLLETADLTLTALDQDAQRLGKVEQNLRRLHLQASTLRCADAAQLDAWWDGVPFERVLLDAPCSASGVVRRHPDSKWLRRAADIGRFAAQQRRLLESLWQVLGTGGKLLYVTCSIFKSENEDLVAAFLRDTRTAEQVPASPPLDSVGRLLPTARNDGFFYATLRKNAQ